MKIERMDDRGNIDIQTETDAELDKLNKGTLLRCNGCQAAFLFYEHSEFNIRNREKLNHPKDAPMLIKIEQCELCSHMIHNEIPRDQYEILYIEKGNLN